MQTSDDHSCAEDEARKPFEGKDKYTQNIH